jgi:autotransporter adhesin
LDAGLLATDAVNVEQMNAAIAAAEMGVPTFLAVADGGSAKTSGIGGLAVGSGASAKTNDTAIGFNSTVTADGSTAVGANTTIDSTNSVAIGADSVVEANAKNGTALGQGASVKTGATNAVALGSGSVATEANTVSVGSVGNERRMVNVAPGVNSTDAVNVSQLNAVDHKTRVNAKNIAKNAHNIAVNRSDIDVNRTTLAQHDTRIKQNQSSINQNRASIESLDRGLNELQDESRAGIAAAAALVELQPTAPGKTMVNLGTAAFKDQAAIGLTMVHRAKKYESLYFNAGASYAGDEMVVRAGCSLEF